MLGNRGSRFDARWKCHRLFTKGNIAVATVLIHNGCSLLHGTFLTQWLLLIYHLHLNIIIWVTSHPFIILNAYKNQQPNNIYSWKQQQYLQAILCEMFLWIRKGKVLSIEFLLSNTIVLIVLYNGMIILIIKSKGCLKLVSTTAQKLSLTLCVLVSPRMDTIASRDQFKPIRFGEKLVANYNLL